MKRRYIWLIVGIIFTIVFIYNWYRSYNEIQIEYYQFQSEDLSEPLDLVIISDLHDYVFNENNLIIIDKIKILRPDAILFIGDMINRESEDAGTVISLIKNLRTIAPIYYAFGNHELEWEEIHKYSLEKQIEAVGAIVLNEEWCDVLLKNQEVRIGGLYEYAFGFDSLDDSFSTDFQRYDYLSEFESYDSIKIMLSHRPDSFIFGDASRRWDIDLVISGHLHGGQVVIPFLGGLYAGDQGFFPEYVHGLYKKDNMHILITSGLSSNKKLLPRWNNPPEIMVLELLPK